MKESRNQCWGGGVWQKDEAHKASQEVEGKERKNSKGRNVTHPLKPRMEFSRGAESDWVLFLMVEVWVAEWRGRETHSPSQLPKCIPQLPRLLLPPLRLLPTVHLAVRRPAAPRHIIKILGCHAYKSQPTSLEMPGGPEGPTPVALASTFPSSGTLKSTARNPEEAPPPRSHRLEGRRERPCYGGRGRECDGNVMRPPG